MIVWMGFPMGDPRFGNVEPEDILAFDIDLHKVYCWSDKQGEIAKGAPTVTQALRRYIDEYPGRHVLMLAEIASPVSAARNEISGNAIGYNLMKWAIFNVASCTGLCTAGRLLVAPSNVWTLGYPLKVRHELAKATSKKKDLRECESMIWSYRQKPAAWITLADYLGDL